MDLSFLTNEANGQIWMVVKIFYLLAFGLYVVFSVIVWRQISLMAGTLKGSIEIPLKAVGVSLIVLALLAMVAAVVIL